MLRSEFIDAIFTFFKCKDEDLKQAYDLAFTVRTPINWDKLYGIVLKETETRYLPAPKWFIDKFERCYKVEEGEYGTPDGTRVRMVLKHPTKGLDIREAETYHISYTLEQMKNYKQKQYGDKFISFSWWDDDSLQWVKV
jgi:hypothetical protein